ncbi:MAG: hypothetical protein EBR09_17245, partial [Proteobacteria bacterium]|nr:hypothetical protein [Pseudomonadota bacterium]
RITERQMQSWIVWAIIFPAGTAGMAACKPAQKQSASEQSITVKGSYAGKWIATLTIGAGVEKKYADLLSETLRQTFLNESGGSYKAGFQLTDSSGWKPSKAAIIREFAALRNEISVYKEEFPQAPTMLVLGLTGHGLSRAAVTNLPEDYIFMVNAGKLENRIPQEFLTGADLAGLIADLNADEIIVFVQSCNSGVLSQTNFLHEYGKILASEVERRRKNIAVITPVNEYILSPLEGIEPIIKKAFLKIQSQPADLGTYAQFKDALVRGVCEDYNYYPKSAIKSPDAIRAAVQLEQFDTLQGLDPQFFESIDPSLPIVLTKQGTPKFRNGTLAIPPKRPPVRNVALSRETQDFCAKKANEFRTLFEGRETERLEFLKKI